jgi:hypothetical protein
MEYGRFPTFVVSRKAESFQEIDVSGLVRRNDRCDGIAPLDALLSDSAPNVGQERIFRILAAKLEIRAVGIARRRAL